jgi:hypothetical protein
MEPGNGFSVSWAPSPRPLSYARPPGGRGRVGVEPRRAHSRAPKTGPRRLTRADIQRRRRRQNRWAWMPWLMGLGTLVLRLLTTANSPTDWDSAQYAVAAGHFDVTHGEPQPPGYWLYVEAGRGLHVLAGISTVQALVLVAALASALGVGFTAAAGRALGGWWVGVAAGALVATSPFVWFSGSTVATYSFDMLACAVMILLAWDARPDSFHGIAAVIALGLLSGFRQSVVADCALVALVAVVASTRSWGRLACTALAGAAATAAWFIPMAHSQPGGASAWLTASRSEASGAAALTSVLDHAAGGSTNIGTFAAYTAVALVPLAAVAILALLALGLRRLIGALFHREANCAPSPGGSQAARSFGWERPWYQGRTVILLLAIVPPVLIVSLVEFAKGGYLLAYLPAAVIALLLPIGALTRRLTDPGRSATIPLVLATLVVAVMVFVGAERFVSGAAVLPSQWIGSTASLWIDQPRYQAPYADTYAAIRSADRFDAELRALGPHVGPGQEVVFDTVDGGGNIYRNAGFELPGDRIALVSPHRLIDVEQHGSLDQPSALGQHGPQTLDAPVGGTVLLVASPAMPGLAALTAHLDALPVKSAGHIGGYLVWQVQTGVKILGVPVVAQTAG